MIKEQLRKAGIAARHLLEFAWSNQSVYLNLIISAIRGVCKTFESDPHASEKLLRKIIEPEHLKNYGYEELFALGEELNELILLVPEFVRDTYIAAFGCKEQPEGAVKSGGNISAFVVPHGAAYKNNLFVLSHHYPQFVQEVPEEAAKVIVPIVRGYIREEQASRTYNEDIPPRSFEFYNTVSYIKPDHSFIWDSHSHFEYDEIKILDAFFSHLDNLCSTGKEELLEKIVQIILKENDLAIIWKRLLKLASNHPKALGKLLLPLAWAKPILEEPDTSHDVGEFIRVIHPDLPEEERIRIEQTIHMLPEGADDNRKNYLEHVRSRLLSCLSPDNIVDKLTKDLRVKLEEEESLVDNEPLFQVGPVTSRPFSTKEYLEEQGVPVNDPKHARILDLSKPLSKFMDDFLNAIPAKEDIERLLPNVKNLYEALKESSSENVNEILRNQGWGWLAGACADMTKSKELKCNSEVGLLVKIILLEASANPEPKSDPVYDEQFNEFQSRGSTAARIDSAIGLCRLVSKEGCLDNDVMKTINKLSNDPNPRVRYGVVCNLTYLYDNAREEMWNFIEVFVHNEQSRGVLTWLIPTLDRLLSAHMDRVVELTKVIYDRVTEGSGAEEVRRRCRIIFLKGLLWENHVLCRQVIEGIIRNPEKQHSECRDILGFLRDALVLGDTEKRNPQDEELRKRALELYREFVEIVKPKYIKLRSEQLIPQEERGESDNNNGLKHIQETLTEVATQLYYASGALDLKDRSHNREAPKLEVRRRFFEETGDLVDSLVELPISPLGHHLLEILETQVDFDPLKVFLRIGTIICGGRSERFEFEYQVVDLFVELIERYLSEHREIFQESGEAQQLLLDMLNIFADAGWPNARRLTYRLGEIYR